MIKPRLRLRIKRESQWCLLTKEPSGTINLNMALPESIKDGLRRAGPERNIIEQEGLHRALVNLDPAQRSIVTGIINRVLRAMPEEAIQNDAIDFVAKIAIEIALQNRKQR